MYEYHVLKLPIQILGTSSIIYIKNHYLGQV